MLHYRDYMVKQAGILKIFLRKKCTIVTTLWQTIGSIFTRFNLFVSSLVKYCLVLQLCFQSILFAWSMQISIDMHAHIPIFIFRVLCMPCGIKMMPWQRNAFRNTLISWMHASPKIEWKTTSAMTSVRDCILLLKD